MEKLTYYSNILEKLHFANVDKKKEYLDFCLNEVKENIILCYNNEETLKKQKYESKRIENREFIYYLSNGNTIVVEK